MSAHSEVLALQERLGISYKDATHRLYMSELEKVKRDRFSFQSYESLDAATTKTLEMAYKRISALEEGSSALICNKEHYKFPTSTMWILFMLGLH